MNNCRPIFILTFFSKIIETILFVRLGSALQKTICNRGHCPPIFIFAPTPDLFFALHCIFFKVSIALTVKIVVILTVPSPIRISILFD